MSFIDARLRFFPGAKFAYASLNTPTACPPRTAVPVNRPFAAGAGAGPYWGTNSVRHATLPTMSGKTLTTPVGIHESQLEGEWAGTGDIDAKE
ncbi:hypothetical protein SCARR_05430 [Pontiella sulfatireligans]|uniref:Uncharacterized protein n=1 Tax=Pontiella sulfatireligans TaxID=2750658 RepID=A0A6C2UTN1_9BACT|nr:hypothetical protein SCARR_05430 [Pontiella sulfatireligans]